MSCLKCKNPKVVKPKKGRMMFSLNCAVYDSKKSWFMKDQEASGLLICLEIRTSLSKIPIVDLLLFYGYKLNKIINKFLLVE